MRKGASVAFVFLLASVLATSSMVLAAFTSTANETVSAQAGTLDLEVTSVSKFSGPTYLVVTPSILPSTTVTINAGPFAPGDTVDISYTIKNFGTLPATSITVSGPSVASQTYDTAFSVTCAGLSPTSLAAGASFTTHFCITLNSGVGNPAEGATATITITYTGTVGM